MDICWVSRTGDQVFVKVSSEKEVSDAVTTIISQWGIGNTDLLISFVTGRESSYLWRQSDQRAAFQNAVTKLIRIGNNVIIDNGLNYGISSLIGSAIRDEQLYTSEFSKSANASIAQTQLIGVVPRSMLSSSKQSQATKISDRGYEYDPNHGHFILLEQPLNGAIRLRVELERHLRSQLGIRRTRLSADGRKPAGGPGVLDAAQVVIFVQGDLEELDQIVEYVRDDVPVIILEGCNGTADVLAGCINSWKGSADEAFADHVNYVIDRVMLGRNKKIEEERRRMAEKVMEILLIADTSRSLKVVDIRNADNLGHIEDYGVLQIAMERAPRVADPRVLEKNWLMTVRSNQIDLANDFLLTKPPWAAMEIPRGALMEALLLPGREAFVDLIVRQLPIRYFLTHMDLLMLYQNTVDDGFFVEHVWDQVLQHHANDPVTDSFVFLEMNYLISKLTGLRDYIDLKELSSNALGLGSKDATAQDRTALNALIVYAVLYNRVELVKVLLKYSIDPVPQAVFVALLFRSLAKYNTQPDIHAILSQNSIDFDDLATELFDMGFNDFPERCHGLLTRKLPEFNNLTTLDVAYKGFCLKFLSHRAIQQFVDDFSFGFVRYRGDYGYMKMMAAAFLIFPMFKWLTFPQIPVRQESKEASIGVIQEDEPREPADSEEAKRYISSLRSRPSARVEKREAERRPPITGMIAAVWSSVVVKYWIWFITYHMFLILIGVDIMLPPCMYLGVDIAVFACTALIWLDLVLRTVKDYLYGGEFIKSRRWVDILFQTGFNILFFLYRIEPFRETQPFSGRVILAFGVLYFYYSVWDVFLYFPTLTAGVVRLLKKNMMTDMFRWIVLMAPLVIATGVVWQATTTPDWPSTGDDWRHAFYRGIFTLFGGFSNELDYDPTCESSYRIDWTNFTQPADAYPSDRCWLGDYSSYSCPTVTVWSYIFVIHYYFLLKLAMLTVLNAYYLHTNIRLTPLAEVLCRYKRFQTIMNYAQRSALPWPFSILGYLIDIVTFKKSKRTRLITSKDAQNLISGVDTEAFTYWRAKAMQFFVKKEREGAVDAAFDGHRDKLHSVQDLVNRLQSQIGFLDFKTRN